MKKKKTYVVQGKRTSLRCPLVLEKSVLEGASDGTCNLTMDIDYPENASTNETVKAIVVVVRCFDGEGNIVGSKEGNSDIFAKQIRFGQDGFPVGEHSQFSFGVDIAVPESGIAKLEVSVGRILFASGDVVDYMHGDFFENTGVIIPLAKVYKGEKLNEITSKFGTSATCVPEQLSDVVWRCTCSELCQEDVCPNCKNSKEDVFAFFGDTSAVVRPKGKAKKILIIAAIVLAALLIIEALIIGISYLRKKGNDVTEATTTEAVVTTEVTTVVTEPPVDESEELVKAYLEINQFDSALWVAEQNGLGFETISEICSKATEYYIANKDYDTACTYAERVPGYDMNSLYEMAYQASYSAGKYDAAYNYALKLGDKGKQQQIMNQYLNQMLNEHRYDEALELADTSLPDKKESIISDAVDYYCSENDYENAEKYAEKSENDSQFNKIYNSAAKYYSDAEDYDSAMPYALLGQDSTAIGNIANNLSDFGLKKYGTTVFSYLSETNKRRALSTKVAAGRYGAAIKADGTVSYGAGLTYIPNEGLTAVSVSVGEAHTVILLSDGSVVSFGDNTYGQCATTTWSKIVAISAGKYHTVGLRSDGSVLAVGDNSKGQIRVSSFKSVVSISAGDRFTVAVASSGKVLSTGENVSGQCDTGAWTDIVAVAAGSDFTLAVKKDGTVVGCGSRTSGKRDVDSWENVISVAAGQSTGVGLCSDGTVLVSGGTIGQGRIDVSGLTGITDIAAGQFGIVVMNASGNIYSLGFGAPKIK